MTDIIRLLPDSVANQIAAGEVIQRPASVVKELVENAIDAGAGSVQVYLKNSGKTQIQVIDNGCGMSETDARLSFERHATSKIRDSHDLFSLHTLGFRGEALASIAAVAEIQLRTKRANDEVGTQIDIAGTRISAQTPVQCPVGSAFTVKNLFFNVPARRKFLKSDTAELTQALNEFKRIALVYTQTALSVSNNRTDIYTLPASNLKQRIVHLFGKTMNQALLPIATETTLVKISGFVALPEYAKKSAGEQFFFANGRYIRHPYLHKAVMQAYEGVLPPEFKPVYFIYFEVPPETIDINRHPTKTEVKFEDEQVIFQFLLSSVKQSLGKFNVSPAIDFDGDSMLQVPVLRPGMKVSIPSVDINPAYNPFRHQSARNNIQPQQWEALYAGFENEKQQPQLFTTPEEMPADSAGSAFLQLKGKYILTPIKSGLMLIDQKRAHERILFDRFRSNSHHEKNMSQQSLFPETVELSPDETALWTELKEDFAALGFDIRQADGNVVCLHGHPGEIGGKHPGVIFRKLLDEYRHSECNLADNRRDRLSMALAREAAISYNEPLTEEEMNHLVEQLFVCSTPNYSPTGKPVAHILTMDDIGHFFNG
ncbi:MAG: DNA mismatch repair endonuclease MutL [Bacteroidales bacterium]|jgi:DNA mismatch repair protein MutL|nr:DNA mismatch repair endonuclease MutL [Bacteroidales bacterium]